MSTAVLVEYIDQHRDRFGVEPICQVLREAGMQIAPSTEYAAKTRRPRPGPWPSRRPGADPAGPR